MIEHKMKIEDAIRKAGGRFKLTTLIQKRLQELNKGAPSLVEMPGRAMIDVVLEEILQDKIQLVTDEELKNSLLQG
ncbi:MAG: DNA-directed RNA polymerase subunit omega [Candidatus Brocadiae bacterium]|nr:DNA-directed RNA polymerase subunit omega [Candidatus Brocadiia bacterium]